MAPKSLEKSAERAEDCFADWEGAKATAEPAIRERRATVFMVDSSCFFDFVEIEANNRAGNDEGALVACRKKETKIEAVGNFTQREESESMHQRRASNDTRTTTKTSLLCRTRTRVLVTLSSFSEVERYGSSRIWA